MAKAAMLGGVGIPLVAGLQQKKNQDEETLKHVQALMDGMRKDASMPSATNGEMMARLIAEKQQQEAALNNMMEGIKIRGCWATCAESPGMPCICLMRIV